MSKKKKPRIEFDSMEEFISSFLDKKGDLKGDLPKKKVLEGKALAQKKVLDLEHLKLSLLTDLDARLALHRIDWSHLPDATVASLRQTLADATENIIKGYMVEYERQMGRYPGLRVHHIDHYMAMVYYYYTPGQPDEPGEGLPGRSESLDIIHVFINNMDIISYLPAHALEELREELLMEENK